MAQTGVGARWARATTVGWHRTLARLGRRCGQHGLRIQHLLDSIVDEFAENEDLPNTTNPDDWARISGKKGERIVYIRTLVTGKSSSASRAIDTESNLGQYL